MTVQTAEQERTGIMLVDDHPSLREGLKVVFQRDSRFVVCGEAGSCKEALRVAKSTTPKVIFVDVSLPDGSGLLLVPQLVDGSFGELRVVVLSMHTRLDYILQAVTAGARGYLSKASDPDVLVTAASVVAQGEYFFDSFAVDEIFRSLSGDVSPSIWVSDPSYAELTAREKELLRHVLTGRTNRQIAKELNISIRTVENHRASIMRKVGVHSPVDLYQYAVRVGLVEADGKPR